MAKTIKDQLAEIRSTRKASIESGVSRETARATAQAARTAMFEGLKGDRQAIFDAVKAARETLKASIAELRPEKAKAE